MIGLLLLYGCGDKPAEETPQYLYETYCGLCHGMDGEGYLAPQANALANPEFLAAATDEFLIESTIYGRPSTKMSAWGDVADGPLNDDQVHLIVEYMRAWEVLPRADIHDLVFEGDIDNGAVLYEQYCSYCHAGDGSGASALSLNNPEFLRVASDGFIWHAIFYGRSGTTMQSYEQILTDQDMADLVLFIRSWES